MAALSEEGPDRELTHRERNAGLSEYAFLSFYAWSIRCAIRLWFCDLSNNDTAIVASLRQSRHSR